jgi:coenzyme Q-binding protein COQ10
MARHTETRILPYSAELMYAVVADVEKYPEFLPWCRALRVLTRECRPDCDVLLAEMEVGFGHLRDRYTSRVILNSAGKRIEVTQNAGPFRRLENRWQFAPAGEGARVDFLIDFEFRNPLINALAGGAFDHAMRRMADAFEARARILNGRNRIPDIALAIRDV